MNPRGCHPLPNAMKKRMKTTETKRTIWTRTKTIRSLRPELAVSSITQPRKDKSDLVEAFVQRRNVNRYVGMGGTQPLDARRCGNQAEIFDALDTPSLQNIDGCYCRAACCQHRVENDADLYRRRRRQAVIV